MTADKIAKARAQKQAWKAANREKVNAAERERYRSNPEYFQDYYRANAERLRALRKVRYYADPAAAVLSSKEWAQANPERALKNKQAHYAANKATIKQRVVDWNAANPEATRARNRNYRARLFSAEGSHTSADIKALYAKQHGLCVYCQTPLGTTYHVDHIQPLSRGGSNWPANLQLTCRKCNNHKRATDPIEYARRIRSTP